MQFKRADYRRCALFKIVRTSAIFRCSMRFIILKSKKAVLICRPVGSGRAASEDLSPRNAETGAKADHEKQKEAQQAWKKSSKRRIRSK